MDARKCPLCGTGSLSAITDRDTVTHKGVSQLITFQLSQCDECKAEQANSEQMEFNKAAVVEFRGKVVAQKAEVK